MEYVFHAREGAVQSDGNKVSISIDNHEPIIFPVSHIYRIDLRAPQGDGFGQVTLVVPPSKMNPRGIISFTVDSRQYSEAIAFGQGLRTVSVRVSGAPDSTSAVPSAPIPSVLASSAKSVAWWIPVLSGILALALGIALGWGFTQMHASDTLKRVVASKDAEIEKLDISVNSLKEQLESALQRENEQDGRNEQNEPADSDGPGNTEGKPNEDVSNGGITMKLLESGEKPTISFDSCGHGCSNGKFAPKNPDADTKFWVVTVEVTNNTKKPLDITCGYPYEIVALNSDNQQYTPIDDLYDVEGNPECNAGLQPGTKTKVTYPFQVPLNAKMVGIAFRDVGDLTGGTPGQDNYAIIITDSNYYVSR